jgi:hypothetical protein
VKGITMAVASESMHSSVDIPAVSAFPIPRTRLLGWACRLDQLRRTRLWRAYDVRGAVEGASDGEIRRLTAHGARLDANAVRWDIIGASTSGRRYRI